MLLRPLVVLSERISRSLHSNDDVPVTSPEEIRLLASLGRSAGVVGSHTAGMIVGATHLSNLRAHDVMLPREEVHILNGTMNRDRALAIVREDRPQPIPVFAIRRDR